MNEPQANIPLPPKEKGEGKNIEETEKLKRIEEERELFTAAKNGC